MGGFFKQKNQTFGGVWVAFFVTKTRQIWLVTE